MYITKRQSISLALSILGLFFLLVIVLMQFRPKTIEQDSTTSNTQETPSTSSNNSSAQPQVALENFHRSETKDGVLVWEVQAKHGQLEPQINRIRVQEVNLTFFRKNGEKTKLSANQADLAMNGPSLSKAEASGNVVLIHNDQVTIKTEQANYDKEQGLVSAPGDVTITSSLLEIKGQGLEVLVDQQQMTLAHKIFSVINAKQPNGKDQNEAVH